MSFESMPDVLRTVREYSQKVINLYQTRKDETEDAEVQTCLDVATATEQRLEKGVAGAASELSSKQRSAQFKWHDRKLLFDALHDMEQAPLRHVEDAVRVVERCDSALLGYFDALRASTNSTEVLELIDSLSDMRQRELQKFSWQATREVHTQSS